MAEYIEREAAYEKCGWYNTVNGKSVCAVRKDEIASIPAADVAPVVHGEWVGLEYDGYADGCPVYDLWECSECGEEVSGEDVPTTHPYCHGCGADMRERKGAE